jgi:hypothetical protein
MKIELENTTKIVEIIAEGGKTVPARIWEGKTASGIPVHAYITRIACAETECQNEFERELKEYKPPSPVIDALPLRIIL